MQNLSKLEQEPLKLNQNCKMLDATEANLRQPIKTTHKTSNKTKLNFHKSPEKIDFSIKIKSATIKTRIPNKIPVSLTPTP